jgi:hypothetical protein
MGVRVTRLPLVVLKFWPIDRFIRVTRQVSRWVKARRRPFIVLIVMFLVVMIMIRGMEIVCGPVGRLLIGLMRVSFAHQLLQASYFLLRKLDISSANQAFGKPHGPKADPRQSTDDQADRFKNPSNFAIPTF